jgi:hypothetical protein
VHSAVRKLRALHSRSGASSRSFKPVAVEARARYLMARDSAGRPTFGEDAVSCADIVAIAPTPTWATDTDSEALNRGACLPSVFSFQVFVNFASFARVVWFGGCTQSAPKSTFKCTLEPFYGPPQSTHSGGMLSTNSVEARSHDDRLTPVADSHDCQCRSERGAACEPLVGVYKQTSPNILCYCWV